LHAIFVVRGRTRHGGVPTDGFEVRVATGDPSNLLRRAPSLRRLIDAIDAPDTKPYTRIAGALVSFTYGHRDREVVGEAVRVHGLAHSAEGYRRGVGADADHRWEPDDLNAAGIRPDGRGLLAMFLLIRNWSSMFAKLSK